MAGWQEEFFSHLVHQSVHCIISFEPLCDNVFVCVMVRELAWLMQEVMINGHLGFKYFKENGAVVRERA